jgi:hypothetical protein
VNVQFLILLTFCLAWKLNAQAINFPSGAYSCRVAVDDQFDGDFGDLGGRLSLAVGKLGGLSGILRIAGKRVPIRSSFDPELPHELTIRISNRNLPLLNLVLEFDPTRKTANGTLNDGGVDSESKIIGWGNVWHPVKAPAERFAGRHNFALTPSGDIHHEGGLPSVTGYGSMRVNKNGSVLLIARTPDNRVISSSSILSPNGNVLLHNDLYNQKGSINGEFDLLADDYDQLSGMFTWAKSPVAGALGLDFPLGFGRVGLVANGGKYSVRSREVPLLEPPPVTRHPTIASFSPVLGGEGQWIYVDGTNFVHRQTEVLLDGRPPISATVYSSTQLGFRMPIGVVGSVLIGIQTPVGMATSENAFTVGAPTTAPVITSFSPTLGPVGQWVYVAGTGFVTGQTQVTLGQSNNFGSTVYSPTSLGFRIPAGTSGTSAIQLSTPNGTAVSDESFTIGIPLLPPTANTLSPAFAPVGYWIYLTGENFVFGMTTVAVGGISNIPATVYHPKSLGFRVPVGAMGSGTLEITTPNGVAMTEMELTIGEVGDVPRIQNFAPTHASPETRITVFGENFVLGGTTVTVGGVAGIATRVRSQNELSFLLPQTASGNTPITVESALGESTSLHPLTISKDNLNADLSFAGGGIESLELRPDIQFSLGTMRRISIPGSRTGRAAEATRLQLYPETGQFIGSCVITEMNVSSNRETKRFLRFRGFIIPLRSGYREGRGAFMPAIIPTHADRSLKLWQVRPGSVRLAHAQAVK